jgi:hypothetical protein
MENVHGDAAMAHSALAVHLLGRGQRKWRRQKDVKKMSILSNFSLHL